MVTTRDRIREAFELLMESRSYKSISIQNICDEAGVSRRTFYKNFGCKEDVVLEQIEKDFVDPVLSIRSLLPVDSMDSSTTMMLERTYEVFHGKQNYYRAVAIGCGAMWFVEAYTSRLKELNASLYSKTLAPDELDFVSHYFAAAGAMTLKWWIDEDFKTPPKRVAELVQIWGWGRWREIGGMKSPS